MINFDELIVEGFGSLIKKKTFQLNQEGLNIIRGKVGSGKTSIPSVIYWVIYGTTLKKGATVQTWEEYQDSNFKGTLGKLNFRIGKDSYSIIRCIQYKGIVFEKQKGGSKIIIIKNGKELKSEDKGKKGIQSLINSIIGYSPDLFINSIIYGQRLKRIIEESGPNKKKIFDEAFETLFIDKAKDKTSNNLKDANNLWTKLNDKRVSLEEQQSDIDSTIDDLLLIEANFEKDKKSKLTELDLEETEIIKEIKTIKIEIKKVKLFDESITPLEDKLIKVDKTINDTKSIISEHRSLSAKLIVIKDKLKKLKTLKSELKSNKFYHCPECGSLVGAKDKEIKLKETIKSLSQIKIEQSKLQKKLKLIGNIENKLQALQGRRDSIKESISSINSNVRTKKLLEDNLSKLIDRQDKINIKALKVTMSKLEIKSDKYKQRSVKISKKLKSNTKEINQVSKQIEMYKWLIKEPLSNSGIKAYIFDSLLSQVNDNLKNYSEILGFRVEFGIDMGTAAKDFYQVIYKDDLIINYPDLSGGQKQLVDTSIALAIHDVISTLKPMNILFLDEPFEGLDTDTIDVVSEIISYKSIGRSLFIITHHASFNPTNSNTLYFELDSKGNTQIN